MAWFSAAYGALSIVALLGLAGDELRRTMAGDRKERMALADIVCLAVVAAVMLVNAIGAIQSVLT